VSADLGSFTAVFAIAVLSPLVSDAFGRRVRVSALVIEILAGAAVGPHGLGLAHTTGAVSALSEFGLAFLIFLAGFELDFARVRGRPIATAGLGWLVSLAIGVGIGAAAATRSGVTSWAVVGLGIATTGLVVLLPLWRDAGMGDTAIGALGSAIGTAGEFGPLVVLSLVLTDRSAVRTTVVLVAFALVAVGGAVLAARPKSLRVVASLTRHTHGVGQLPVRITVLILVALLWLTTSVGLDALLGAFAAGILVRLGSSGLDFDAVSANFDAIGYGILVPVFFVVSGMELDVGALVRDPRAILRVPLFLVGLLVARGTPVWLLHRRVLPRGERWPLALFSATTLPIVVVIDELARNAHLIDPSTSVALVTAAVLSVLAFPTAAFALLDRIPGGVPGGLAPTPPAGAADPGSDGAAEDPGRGSGPTVQ